MARVMLDIDDTVNRMTLSALLESDGHEVGAGNPDVAICDDAERAIRSARSVPTLLLTPVSAISEAVAAMRQGVYGYITLPFQPGEASIMVRQAAGKHAQTGPDGPELISLEEMEKRHIRAVLRHCNNNRLQAAKILGIGRNTLWRKLKRDP